MKDHLTHACERYFTGRRNPLGVRKKTYCLGEAQFIRAKVVKWANIYVRVAGTYMACAYGAKSLSGKACFEAKSYDCLKNKIKMGVKMGVNIDEKIDVKSDVKIT